MIKKAGALPPTAKLCPQQIHSMDSLFNQINSMSFCSASHYYYNIPRICDEAGNSSVIRQRPGSVGAGHRQTSSSRSRLRMRTVRFPAH